MVALKLCHGDVVSAFVVCVEIQIQDFKFMWLTVSVNGFFYFYSKNISGVLLSLPVIAHHCNVESHGSNIALRW